MRIGDIVCLKYSFKILTFNWESRYFLIQLIGLEESPENRLHIPLATAFVNRGYHPYLKWIPPNTLIGKSVYSTEHPYRANSLNHVDYMDERWIIEYKENSKTYELVRDGDSVELKCLLETRQIRNSVAYKMKKFAHQGNLVWGTVVRIRDLIKGTEYKGIPEVESFLTSNTILMVTISDPQYFTEYEVPSKFIKCNV